MTRNFDKLVKEMPQLLERLKKQHPRSRTELAGIPTQGVYVLYEENKVLYVGRSNHLKTRIQQHGRASSRQHVAPFAYKLGVEMIKSRGVDISPYSRKQLEKKFSKDFAEARRRIAEMRVRLIEIREQEKQALFEIYATIELRSRYNDFDTH
jgi:hypothetical protein